MRTFENKIVLVPQHHPNEAFQKGFKTKKKKKFTSTTIQIEKGVIVILWVQILQEKEFVFSNTFMKLASADNPTQEITL